MQEPLRVNRANWDERAPAHAASPDYAVQRFVDDPGFLSGVVAFDRPRLGEVCGLDAIHLQCHIGTDTVSLARLGARVTGLDFSPASLQQARSLARRTATDVRFVESDVDGALDAVHAGGFDLVYTGIGALCWLPSIARWAEVVAASASICARSPSWPVGVGASPVSTLWRNRSSSRRASASPASEKSSSAR